MLHIIVNPATGGGRGRKISGKIESILKQTGTEYKIYCPKEVGGLAGIISLLSEGDPEDGEYTDIVLVGGDGTMNAAVNAIRDFDHTRLALIPSGSGNDLGKDLGIPEDLSTLVSRIIRQQTVRSIDIGLAEVNGEKHLFNISSGLGFDAETCVHVEKSRMKKFLNIFGLGKLVYIVVAIGLILKNETFNCWVELPDGEVKKYEKCLFAVGMNHRYEGGGFMFCPEAKDNDGVLDFCVVDGVGAGKFMMMFPSALSGRHVKYKEIDLFKASEVRICVEKSRNIHTDGEAGIVTDRLKLSIYEKKLHLLI